MKKKLPRFGPRSPTPQRDLTSTYDEGNRFHASLTRRTRRVLDHNRERGYVTDSALHQDENKVQDIVEIVRKLQEKGIFIPRVESFDPKNNLIVFEKRGISVIDWIKRSWGKHGPTRAQKSSTTRIFSKLARHLASLHRLGIFHGHPHFRNFVISGNRVGTIDYKRAGRINLRNPTQATAQIITDILSRS